MIFCIFSSCDIKSTSSNRIRLKRPRSFTQYNFSSVSFSVVLDSRSVSKPESRSVNAAAENFTATFYRG